MYRDKGADASFLPAPAALPTLDRLGRARLATAILFLVDGTTFGTWAALIPSFQQRFGLSTGQLSWVLIGIVAGAMVSMPVAGRLAAAHGSHRLACVAGLTFPACLLALMLSPNLGWLVAAGVLFGACKGLLDIAVNAQGIAVENALGKPVMSSFNGYWSSGGLVAAATLTWTLHHGVSPSLLLGVMAVGLMGTTLVVSGHLLPEEGVRVAAAQTERWTLPDRRLLWLGALAFLALFSEGVLLDWSAVYAHSVAGATVATAPVAFAAFSVCMALGRFTGYLVTHRWGTVTALRLSAALLIVGTGVATLVPAWGAVLAGFMVVGLGLANLVPIIFRAGGRVHARGAGPGVATVSTLGYVGFLCGPPTVGFLASVAGLRVAFGVLVVFGVVLGVAGGPAIRAAQRGPAGS